MNPFAVIKVLAFIGGVILALMDPANSTPGFQNLSNHAFRGFCWVVAGMGLSQFAAHLGFARVYYFGVFEPGTEESVKRALHPIKNSLAKDQLLCVLMMGAAMVVPVSAALDWLPLKWWLSPSAFASFAGAERNVLMAHIAAAAAVPVAGLLSNKRTAKGRYKINHSVKCSR